MNDELEKLIIDNREFLLNEEPLEGHFERFERRLQKNVKPERRFNYPFLLKIAAVMIFAVLLVNQARIYLLPEKQQTVSLGSISPEYREVEFYYTSSIQMTMDQWEKMKNQGLISEAEQTMMAQQQAEFDQMYQKLIQDLNANPGDERVINALLEYYQTRINIMNLVINKLKEVKAHQNKSHETNI